MRPRGTPQTQLAAIDASLGRIDASLGLVAEALREARGNDEIANVAICEQRLEELLDERNRVAALLPTPRDAG